MTPRQWNLYNLLKANPDKWFTQKEIVDSVQGYEYHNRNNDKAPQIREDKKAINASLEVDKIIVMKKYCFKLGSEKEIEHERSKHLKRLKAQLDEIKAIDKKLSQNGQGKLLSNKCKEIGENSNVKEFHETYLF